MSRTFSSFAARRRGLSLVEVLLCVAIGSMLLLSVGVAFRGSFNSYKDAQQRGHMLNDARGFMSRVTADIRMCDLAVSYTPSGVAGTGIELTKTHSDGWDPLASLSSPVTVRYWFDPNTNKIWMTRKLGSTPTPPAVVACNYVQSFQIFMQMFKGTNYLQSASITMTLANKDVTGTRILADGGQDLTLTFCDSAAPRRPYPGYTQPPF